MYKFAIVKRRHEMFYNLLGKYLSSSVKMLTIHKPEQNILHRRPTRCWIINVLLWLQYCRRNCMRRGHNFLRRHCMQTLVTWCINSKPYKLYETCDLRLFICTGKTLASPHWLLFFIISLFHFFFAMCSRL